MGQFRRRDCNISKHVRSIIKAGAQFHILYSIWRTPQITCSEAMIMKLIAVCVVVLVSFGSFCDAKPGKPLPPKQPLQPSQQLQTFEKELTWKYPDDPQPDPKPNVPFEQKYPATVPAATVAVECREAIAHVEAKKDLFGIGQPINPNDLVLGNCPPTGEDPVAQVLIYEVELHKCGSQLTVRNRFFSGNKNYYRCLLEFCKIYSV